MRKLAIGLVAAAMVATLVASVLSVYQGFRSTQSFMSRGWSAVKNLKSGLESFKNSKMQERHEIRSFSLRELKKLEIEGNAGDVSIKRGKVSSVRVDARLQSWGNTDKEATESLRKLSWSSRVEDGVLKIGTEEESGGLNFSFTNGNLRLNGHAIDFAITLPQNSALGLDVRGGSGAILAQGVRGDLALKTSSGEITVEQGIGKADLEAGSGDILVEERSGSLLRATTGSGGITLSQVKASPGEVQLCAGSGNIEATLSPKGPWRLLLNAASGRIENAFSESSEENHQECVLNGGTQRFVANTGSGDILLNAAR
ncbi:MAG TPA: hypothetical protein DD435_10325 [Cyanobacteria bacterium UBA8530]|nr:hypothetical protein [Cyanobacteria bacterium UBA8530]